MPGKRIQIDDDTWAALDLLARDRMMDFQELADEAFRDLLRKHSRPANLKAALRQSLGEGATIHTLPSKRKDKKKRPARKR
jgi:predicted DNA-binding ribbon-helix-helix protein